MFCQSCGKQIGDDERFCQYCGSPTAAAAAAASPAQQAPTPQSDTQQSSPVAPAYAPPPPVQQQAPVQPYPAQQAYTQQTYTQPYPAQPVYAQQYAAAPYAGQQFSGIPKKKAPILLICIIGVVVLSLIGVGIYYLVGQKGGWSKSFLVSKGVNTDDLGNIMNGQYYFDDGSEQYYATFDTNSEAHVYRTVGGTTTTIFDGFGWSLVPYKGWLYFSGNEGVKIDGTYNLFRMKTDGSELENINSGYCYGMNIYNNHLYFISSPSTDSTQYDVYQSDLDGTNQVAIVSGEIYNFIIFESKLYYVDSAGDLYCADDNGKNPKLISTEFVDDFIVGNGKIIYQTDLGDIKAMDIDGKNLTTVRPAGDLAIGSLNSYKNKIYFAVYEEQVVEGTYASNYYLYSINFDGTAETPVYSSLSYGIFVNVLNNKIYVLDYAMDPATGYMPAIARSMNLDGSNVQDVQR